MRTSKKQLTLGGLIELLATVKPDTPVLVRAPVVLTPSGVSSYRGNYEDLAIALDTSRSTMDVARFRAMLGDAIGRTFVGYKGGEYTMGRDSALWVSNYGECSGWYPVGVTVGDRWACFLECEEGDDV